MWRGPVVQARKDAVNAAKGKVFSMHAKLIALAAMEWWKPEDNPSLASLITKAKKNGVPNDTIERAIKKWSWEDTDASQISEICYEGYAPGGVAFIISTLTDNKNRTVSHIRSIFSKYGGNMWETWSVSWMFHKKWVIFIDPQKHTYDYIEELAIETDVLDIGKEAWYIKIITEIEDCISVENFFQQHSVELYESKLDYIADNEVEVIDFDKALKITKMREAFEKDEDVNIISSNEIISPELQKEVDDFIEKNTFRT